MSDIKLLVVFVVAICCCFFFFFNDTATTEIYTLSLHDALPILGNYESAVVQFEECLSALGRPFPHTNLQLYASLLWQSVRQVLHRIYIARLFAKIGRAHV